jgi:basic membrane lipoprotein Med (substrate-binding protein (PBP1-ABC) superfamily)
MTEPFRNRVATFVGVVLALLAGSAVAAGLARTDRGDQPRVALVVASENPAVLASARSAASRTRAQLRVPRTAAEQLGVTHILAARGYDAIVTVGVDRALAIAPVAARYPDVRFVETDATGSGLERVVNAATR